MKLVVVGGGAAGFFCAINAARIVPGLEVIILEKSTKLLSKVRISGGGRCNVTHASTSIAEMSSCYPRGGKFVKKAFHHFFVNDTIEWFGNRGVDLKTEIDGRMFPVSDNSETIIQCLLNEASKYGVEIMMHTEVLNVQRSDNLWVLTCAKKQIETDFLCIAAGGFPKEEQFAWLQGLKHTITKPVPSLFTFNMPGNSIAALMGIVLKATVKINTTKYNETGSVLITHWGMSGPAILKLSAWAARDLYEKQYHFSITINWVEGFHEQSLNEKMQVYRFELATQKILNRNPFDLPLRFWKYQLDLAGINENIRWADLPAKQQKLLAKNLTSQQFEVKGKTTFKEEFVTAGGIATDEINVNSMESKILSQLYFAGEIMNVDGITGGYNFQQAWTSGWVAAKAIAESSKKAS